MPAGEIGRYRLQRVVATEATATVHEAVDTETQQRVAVRLLPMDAALSADQREGMRTTALEAAGLQHPGIVELHDFGWDGDTAYVVTAFMEGETLAQYLARVGRLPALQGLSLALQLLAALAAAHERGLVHSALNPQHVLMGRNGQLRIEGFGWVAAAASAGRRPGVFDMSAYMAPEQILGRPADCRADLYSAAVVAYELLAGSWPYQAHAAPRPPRALRRELPVALDAVFERAQAQDPEARFRNAAELAAALQAAFGTPAAERAVVPVRPQRVAPPAPPPPPARADVPLDPEPEESDTEEAAPVRRRRAGMALVAGLAAAVVLGGVFVAVESVRGPVAWLDSGSAAPAPAPSPVVAAPAPPPALAPVHAVPAAAAIEAPKPAEARAKPDPAPAPIAVKTRPAEPRARKAVERPPEPGIREIVVPESIEEPPRETVIEPPAAPRPRETVARPAPQRTAASERAERERERPERPTRTTAVMSAPPSPSPLNVCRQEFSMARDLCVAYECASSEYRQHPVCVRMHADAVVRHKLNQRNGP